MATHQRNKRGSHTGGGALAGHTPVNQLHVWWARRPLIASQAAVAASMLPVNTDREAFISNLGNL